MAEGLSPLGRRARDAASWPVASRRACCWSSTGSFTNADRAGLANAIVSISLKREDLRPVLPAVQAPTLFMTGSAHPDWSPEQLRAAATQLSQGSTRVLDGAAYLVPLESPDEFSRCVQEFWASTHPHDTAG